MNAPASAVGQSLRWPRIGRPDAAAARLREGAVAVAIGGATAAAVTYAPVPRLILVGLAALLVIAFVVFASTALAAALMGVSIPAIQDVTGGHLGGLHVAASDLVLVLIGARILMDGTVRHRLPTLQALRPVAFPVVQYAWLVGVLLVLHLSLGSALKSAQRLELFALPLLVGAFIALRRQHMIVLRGYVLATTVLAIAWPVLNPTGVLGSQFQKNPVGGFIASAILLLLAVRGLRGLRWCMPLLVVGLALTVSRGAIVALVLGIVVIGLMLVGDNRRTVVAGTLAIVITGLVVFQFLPASTTSRITNFSAAGNSAGSWAIFYRDQYYHDAETLIAAHPWTGVGVGNYLTGSAANLTLATDPHDVILLEAAEGGYVFAASFILLVLGVALALWRLRRIELAPAAAAVFLATLAHGLVDVYWVRGTPVLGWLLVGMVCGLVAQEKSKELT